MLGGFEIIVSYDRTREADGSAGEDSLRKMKLWHSRETYGSLSTMTLITTCPLTVLYGCETARNQPEPPAAAQS